MIYWKYVLSLQTMVSFMESHFREKISLDDIARSAGYSTARCDVLFRTFFGETPFDRLRNIRLQAAKTDLIATGSVKKTAYGLAFSSPDAFSRAFRKEYGIMPSAYLKGEKLREKYVKFYEYRRNDSLWYFAQNPTPDGLWEYNYYDPATGEYRLMEWFPNWHFRAFFRQPNKSDPNWYCRIRQNGFGMHPGPAVHAAKMFVCPYSGRIDLFYSVGRFHPLKRNGRRCGCQLFCNGLPVSDPVRMEKYPEPHMFRLSLSVKKGDRIALHLWAEDDIDYTGVMLYRESISYTEIVEE